MRFFSEPPLFGFWGGSGVPERWSSDYVVTIPNAHGYVLQHFVWDLTDLGRVGGCGRRLRCGLPPQWPRLFFEMSFVALLLQMLIVILALMVLILALMVIILVGPRRLCTRWGPRSPRRPRSAARWFSRYRGSGT